ncbi:hypothetical protein OPV22_006483 [Ensete ventricosum]|uniref:Uncharacterized protein n=1 Tax=Ensete ventricosum TaxID=4639 RepID=A0AAV8QBS6_ENSVE|nr:hypothetical protein OPV22_006483 [Ensete ventricosum]
MPKMEEDAEVCLGRGEPCSSFISVEQPSLELEAAATVDADDYNGKEPSPSCILPLFCEVSVALPPLVRVAYKSLLCNWNLDQRSIEVQCQGISFYGILDDIEFQPVSYDQRMPLQDLMNEE